MQSIRQAELAVRQAENGVLEAASDRLELQGLTGRLAAQQQQLASSRHAQELQGDGRLPATYVTHRLLCSCKHINKCQQTHNMLQTAARCCIPRANAGFGIHTVHRCC